LTRLNGTTQATCAADSFVCAGADVFAPVGMWNTRAEPLAARIAALEEALEAEKMGHAQAFSAGWDSAVRDVVCSLPPDMIALREAISKMSPPDTSDFTVVICEDGHDCPEGPGGVCCGCPSAHPIAQLAQAVGDLGDDLAHLEDARRLNLPKKAYDLSRKLWAMSITSAAT
jgi:hypothetical protein